MEFSHGRTILLNNGNSHWKYKSKMIVPNQLAEGFIEHKDSGLVLGIDKGQTDVEVNVILEEKLIPTNKNQQWFRGMADSKGWFTLTDPISGKVLTLSNQDNMTISGTYL